MSYSVVPTVATGDVWTARNHNVYVRDNFRAVAPDVVTAKGELIIGDGANALALLSKSVDGEILQGDLTYTHPRYLFIPSGYSTGMDLSSSGDGNIHIAGEFPDIPDAAGWVYLMIEMRSDISSAQFSLHPSWDTSKADMTAFQVDVTTGNNVSQAHGIMPLDSTGGLFYTMTDTAQSANLYVYGWAY